MDAAEVSLIAVGVSVMSLLSALILGLWLATARRRARVGAPRATGEDRCWRCHQAPRPGHRGCRAAGVETSAFRANQKCCGTGVVPETESPHVAYDPVKPSRGTFVGERPSSNNSDPAARSSAPDQHP